MDNDNSWRFDTISKLLHWTIAVLLVGLVCVGWYMMSIEDQPNSGWYFDMHKSFGLVAASLILLRIVWRVTHKPAPLPLSVPRWQVKVALLVQGLLYVCMIVMPLTGFIGASFSKHAIVFFGLPLPSWVNPNHDIAELFFEVHETVAWILVALVGLHVLGAFKHLFIDKDAVFQRMLF